MKYISAILIALLSFGTVWAQEGYKGKFEQLGTTLPTPNEYRNASGAPGYKYWQQQADYDIQVELDDDKQSVTGSEKITYYNNSPEPLTYLWLQLDQNMRAQDSNTPITEQSSVKDSLPARVFQKYVMYENDFEGGFKIKSVTDDKKQDLKYIINKTMMKIALPQTLNPGENFSFHIDWSYNINDRMQDGGRSGYEHFPEDDNYLYTIAQFYPRMVRYDDVNGWQNKQFLGNGEFTLSFGDFKVAITVPDDHIVASTGELQNAKEVLTAEQNKRLAQAKTEFEKPVLIVTEVEARENEKTKATGKKTWIFKADRVRDFAFASSRKFIWDAMAVKINDKQPMAMSFYPKEGNPLWEKESTLAVKNTLVGYSNRSFDYPYPVAISVHAASIGMEYPMICFNFGRPEPDGSYTDSKKWGMIAVIIHEVGHNFFPMIVNSDERQWTWMDEGLNTFLENLTAEEFYPDMPLKFGTPQTIVTYMGGDKEFIRPIMTNSEQIMQFGYNAYGKPSAALYTLRNTIMGPELFDVAFKEYAQRWKFKSPTPADFFRTMEDASAVDLDWFWKGWFYTTDHVDLTVDNVKWYKMEPEEATVEKNVKAKKGSLNKEEASAEASTDAKQWPDTYEPLTVTDTDPRFYGEFMNRQNDDAIRKQYEGKNIYEVSFKNEGGLVMPLIVVFNYADGSSETRKIPAEIWRKNENTATKVFALDKEVVSISLDPDNQTADVDLADNVFPRAEDSSKFDQFKNKNTRE
ncbi:M1 family metallopeptidase [Catalinimonas niigatensis]|uniref:M1 family metallopeptidase n=1 Tax=Catalinimonas niigatensis TaxID=1397264 RepID=UPI002666124D|nr:M1 family metallopeptidase [Catalinimonas niigatensis]WPP53087.1 M1 family metallopeptidase [Catalinimonas niigatensis]